MQAAADCARGAIAFALPLSGKTPRSPRSKTGAQRAIRPGVQWGDGVPRGSVAGRRHTPSKEGRFLRAAARSHVTIGIMAAMIWITLVVTPLPAAPTEGAAAEVTAAPDTAHLACIPFEVDRNKTVLRVEVGGSRPLRLILDTGMPMDGVFLFHKGLSNEIALEGAIDVLIPGAGGGEPSKGIMAESVPVSAGDVVFGRQRVIISLSDHTQGFPTDGVIGWSLFGHYAVELDYDTMVMTLHPPGSFVPDSTWQAVSVTLKENVPWVSASVDVLGEGSVPETQTTLGDNETFACGIRWSRSVTHRILMEYQHVA